MCIYSYSHCVNYLWITQSFYVKRCESTFLYLIKSGFFKFLKLSTYKHIYPHIDVDNKIINIIIHICG